MDPWHKTLQLSLSTVHACMVILCVGLDVRVIDQVAAFEDSSNANRSTASCVGNSCHASTFDRRLQSGLTIGAVCLLLLVGGGLMFAYRIRKMKKQQSDDISKKVKRRKKKKKNNKQDHSQRQNHSETVFTISNDQGVAMEESDKLKLVFPDVATAQQSRHHMEDTFNSYGKPVDCEDRGT